MFRIVIRYFCWGIQRVLITNRRQIVLVTAKLHVEDVNLGAVHLADSSAELLNVLRSAECVDPFAAAFRRTQHIGLPVKLRGDSRSRTDGRAEALGRAEVAG